MTVGEYSASGVSVIRVISFAARLYLKMSVFAPLPRLAEAGPPRTDANRMACPSGVKDGWLS
jgi:hypothetical protein